MGSVFPSNLLSCFSAGRVGEGTKCSFAGCSPVGAEELGILPTAPLPLSNTEGEGWDGLDTLGNFL